MGETIAAIATGMGDSGIGIIRISGDTALQIVDQIFQPVNKKKTILNMDSYTAAYGKIIYEDEIYDEAVALVMRAPKTYTTEDVVELDCHGGITVLKRVLDLVIRLGARPAEPGEFTKRAFLGGRIDMSQAESVMDLIHAKNDMAGDEEDSWGGQLKRAGYDVECHIIGLGELEGIQNMFVRHVREAK